MKFIHSRNKKVKNSKFIGTKVNLPLFVPAMIVDSAFSKINKIMELKLLLIKENTEAVGLLLSEPIKENGQTELI